MSRVFGPEIYPGGQLRCPREIGYMQNFPPDENLSIRSGNKSKIILPEDSFSNIPSGMDTPIPSQENFNSVVPSGINSPIPLGTNYAIPSGDIFLFPLGICPRFQKIPTSLHPTSLRLPTPRYI